MGVGRNSKIEFKDETIIEHFPIDCFVSGQTKTSCCIRGLSITFYTKLLTDAGGY